LHEKEETEPQLRSSVTPKTAEENSGQKTTHLGLTLCSNRLLGTLPEAIQLGVSCQSIRSIADNPVRGVGIADSNFAVGPVTLWDSSCSDLLLYYTLRITAR